MKLNVEFELARKTAELWTQRIGKKLANAKSEIIFKIANKSRLLSSHRQQK